MCVDYGDGKSAWENFLLHSSSVAPSKLLPNEWMNEYVVEENEIINMKWL